jgi:proteasome accessory factor C
MSDAHERLRRLLLLVPYVRKHPGIPLEALAKRLDLSREDLLADLDLLTLVGRPPFQPDDFIDIQVENDKVFVHLDQRLTAPPRFTPSEATALAAAAAVLKPAAGDALKTALTKLEKILPPDARRRFREMGGKIDASVEAPGELAPLNRAVAEVYEVEFDYFSHARGETERRRVRPLELFSHRGQWYLYAFSLSRGDERLFRLDRIQNVSVTQTRFERVAHRGSIPNPVRQEGSVRVRFSQSVAPYLRERFGNALRNMADGSVEVNVTGESERWLTQWVLSFGGEAAVISPESVRQRIVEAARASLKSVN